ncbi:MAG TPA: DNA polymerase domain-containing protein [Leptospiraceae bacterium]|nr:DNA polymerase domain-containing protein [Leptospiraceae bacterium]HNJ33144.1 DNA polymerase domain-containing protein [Leptospiraceae bacterium]HNN59897.1 DNA polymerase domain-containing protein [Leptospiraceae bacterium]HNN75491.1 DNA polymerase domain-containing protein [Leptospiraceae bacterium]
METVEGTLLDVYNFNDEIHLWIKTDSRALHFIDSFHPIIFADGPVDLLKKLVTRFHELGAIHGQPVWTIRNHFYDNSPRRVLKITIAKPAILNRVRRRLYSFYGKLDLYHTDIEIPVGYMFHKNIHPLSRVRIDYTTSGQTRNIERIVSLDRITDLEFDIPPFKQIGIKLEKSHRLGLKDNRLIFETSRGTIALSAHNQKECLLQINRILAEEDPDIIVSSYGDQIIFPELFTLAQTHNIPLLFDRHGHHSLRKIVREGTSFNTYGSWIFRAASYPLFGRLHVDAHNSFVFKESRLVGIFELARLARTPIQRMSRQSTGGALTSIETHVAIRKHYLVPWQKSAVEKPKTAYDLLAVDKGGLIFVPNASETSVFENVAQLDYSQMYPSIMVNHNISPECVNCPCCANDPSAPKVPEAGYHICKRRRGVVSDALAHILFRRKYYKTRLRELKAQPETQHTISQIDFYDARQDSLKWMLVTSFGYLGYRNAKFGRIESHESVTAFGREKLLLAKEIAEEEGYTLSHAITDCVFLHRQGQVLDKESILRMAESITNASGIEMSLDGIYSWVIFLPSRQDRLLPVVNRYCGRFLDGSIKFRGIAARRKDTASFIRNAQLELLEIMAKGTSIEHLRSLHSEVMELYDRKCSELRNGTVPWEQLLLRKTTSREFKDYQVKNATYLAMEQLSDLSLKVQAGEKVRYVVLNTKHPDRRKRYLSEESAALTRDSDVIPYDVAFYLKMLREAFYDLWSYFSPPDSFVEEDQPELFSGMGKSG